MTELLSNVEQKLVKEIALKLSKNDAISWMSLTIINQNWYLAIANELLALINQALPALAKEEGYVKLAEDQDTPQYTGDFLSAFDAKRAESNFTDVLYDFGVQVTKDMLKAGWRKVKLGGKSDTLS